MGEQKNMNLNNIIGYLIIIFIAAIIIPSYFSTFVNKNKNNCKNIGDFEIITPNDIKFYDNYLKKSEDNEYYKLKHFYIKTAYNCFCSGDFKNDYVNSCALVNCKKNGVRALDIQVFSLNGIPIIAANSLNTNYYKETFNYITFEEGIREINDIYKLTNNIKKNSDPIFLILRLHYDSIYNENKDTADIDEKKMIFYNKIYKILTDEFSNIEESSFTNNYTFNNYSNLNDELPNITIQQSKYKIFLFLILNEGESNSTDTNLLKKSNLSKITDDYGNDSNTFNYDRYNTYINSDKYSTKVLTKNNLYYCMPNLGPNNNNYNFSDPLLRGIQFIGMNFQNNDKYLKEYNKFFQENSDNLSFVKKSNDLII
tara:strand:+ start:1544 stop:2650 length:1107 start_codon:yes stop_codon:yes gene_type:complete